MTPEDEILLQEGKMLPIMEEFYSLQGEGYHTGKATYFARIGGCDVGCHWCDSKASWDASKYHPIATDLIIERAIACPAKAVIVTGGEPLLYNLDYLCDRLQSNGMETFLETSGYAALSGKWDWLCLSPKKEAPPLRGIFEKANELKMIIEDESDFEWAEQNASLVQVTCPLYLQPEWSRRDIVIPMIVAYIKLHPQWKISLQAHKYMRIP
jgi:7-carboxy-7-deazaguanine synthase